MEARRTGYWGLKWTRAHCFIRLKLKGFLREQFVMRFKRGYNSSCISGRGIKMVAHAHLFYWARSHSREQRLLASSC